MILRELNNGDRFIHSSAKIARKADKFMVCGKSEFNRQAGTATRKCKNLTTGEIENKQCILKIIQLPITQSINDL